MENKRRFQRFSMSEPVGYQQEGRSPEGSLSEDISQAGIKLNVSQFIPLNTTLELRIQVPGHVGTVAVLGKVVWVKEVPYRDDAWEIGLELAPSPEFASAVEEYISFHRFESFS
jgi:hypothetical protein